MKFTASRDELYQAVQAVMRATTARVIQPILANILFVAESEASPLRLAATDLDFSLQTTLNAVIAQSGRSTLNAKKLAEILAKLPAHSQVQFDVDLPMQSCKVSCGSSHFELRTLPAEEFPTIAEIDARHAIELPLAELVKSIKQTEFAASKQDTNNILGGVYFKLTPQGLDMVATDGSRLARHQSKSLNTTSLGEEGLSAIIPARTFQEFMRLSASTPVQDGEDKALLAVQQGQVFLSTTRFNAVSRLLEGQYPRYEQLIPKECSLKASMNRAALVSSLERTAVMANERTQIVKMSLSQGLLTLAADTPDVGHSQDTLPIHYEGEPLHIAFNFKFVLDALKVMEGDSVLLETNGPLAPTLFKDETQQEQYLCLVMPVQVR
jgi:DNA polymerase-3 subunit beta